MLKKAYSLFALLFIASFIVAAIPAGSDGIQTIENIYDSSDVEYPRGYTHRPFVGFYTSLSCPPCMANAEPAHSEYWLSNGYETGTPVTTVVFHLTNGGAGDDPLFIQEARDWNSHQRISGTPTILVDDGYFWADSSTSSLSTGVETTGARVGTPSGPLGVVAGEQFKVAEVEVLQMFTGTEFKVKATVNYIENQGGPIVLGNNNLNGFINIYMVEDQVEAYSSNLDENVTCYNAFRGFAANQESVSLSPGDSWEGEFSWTVPNLDRNANQVPVNVKNVFPVAVLYDADDTTSGGSSGKPGATRSINSATPSSTAYDRASTLPEVGNLTAYTEGGRTRVSTMIKSAQGIESAFIAYTTNGPKYTGQWDVAEMNISEDGEATAYLDTLETVNYQLMVYDSNWTELKTEIAAIQGIDSPEGSKGSGIMLPLIVIIGVVGVLLFLFKDRIPVLNEMLGSKQSVVGVVDEEETPVNLVDDGTEPTG